MLPTVRALVYCDGTSHLHAPTPIQYKKIVPSRVRGDAKHTNRISVLDLLSRHSSKEQALFTLALQTLYVPPDELDHFVELQHIDRAYPTRTLLLIIPNADRIDYPASLLAFNRLTSFSIVVYDDDPANPPIRRLPPARDYHDVMFLAISRLARRAEITRLSVSRIAPKQLDLCTLDLREFTSLTHLRLVLDGTPLIVPTSFRLPPKLEHLSLSPQLFTQFARIDVVLEALSSIEVACHDAADVLSPEHRTASSTTTFGPPYCTHVIPLGCAIETFLQRNARALNRVEFDRIDLTPTPLRALFTLPNLTDLHLHPSRWIIGAADESRARDVPPARPYNDNEAVAVFAKHFLPFLPTLQFLHIGAAPHPPDETTAVVWCALITAAPRALKAVARNKCSIGPHHSICGSCPAATQHFAWTREQASNF